MKAIDDTRGAERPPGKINLARHVLWSQAGDDDKVALVVIGDAQADAWTYAMLRDAVLRMGGGLIAAGLRPGQKLLMRLGNTPDFPVVFLGAIAAGIIPVPTSAALTKAEITKLAQVLNPDAIVSAGSVALPEQHYPIMAPAALLAHPPLADMAQTTANDPAYIVFTSGTSGAPTGVVHAHRAIWARRAMIKDWEGLTPDDRLLHAGAFNWTYTLGTGLLDPWSVGATALVLESGLGPEAIPALAKTHEATIIAGAPGVFRRLNRMGLPALPRLRHALSAGEKLPETVRAQWKAATGTDIHEAFGQSECSTFLSGAPHRPAPCGTVGFVQPGRAVAILSEDGIAERGALGRIAVHRSDPGLMLGYLGTTGLTNETWFPTGDLGVMRADASVEYHGRADDVLTSGGFRVSPVEIEEAMHAHPDILEAAAVDFQLDPETRVIKLCFTAQKAIPKADLQAYAKAHLAAHKRPRLFEQLTELPRNPNGKLLRKSLRAANESA